MVKKWFEISNEKLLKQYDAFQEVFGKDNLKDFFFFICYASEDFKVKEGIVFEKMVGEQK